MAVVRCRVTGVRCRGNLTPDTSQCQHAAAVSFGPHPLVNVSLVVFVFTLDDDLVAFGDIHFGPIGRQEIRGVVLFALKFAFT